MENINEILDLCHRGDRSAQTTLVRHYGKKLLPVCRRYAPEGMEHDALQETFVNTFKYLKKYEGKGVFDAWIRRIAVNCALALHKKKSLHYKPLDNSTDYLLPPVSPDIYQHLGYQDLMELIGKLPKHYYMVFNLYVIEGYDHKEIGQMLSIGESTSRSNLSRARKKLHEILKKKHPELLPKLAI